MERSTFDTTKVHHVEQALYRSKHHGRDEVPFFEDWLAQGLMVIEEVKPDEISFFWRRWSPMPELTLEATPDEVIDCPDGLRQSCCHGVALGIQAGDLDRAPVNDCMLGVTKGTRHEPL